MNKPLQWSYSVLTSFETCPRRHYLTKVTKEVSEPQSEQIIWGNKVHKALENRIKHNTPIPKEMADLEDLAQSVLSVGGKVEAEQKLALDRNFRPVSWFDKQVWVRGITDVTLVKGDRVFIGDWKTGNPKPESAQLRLTAAMTFHHKPFVKKIINAFVWIKTKTLTTEVFTPDDIPAIWQEFAPRVQRLEIAMHENKFPPKPSGLCRKYCPCTGCEFHGK